MSRDRHPPLPSTKSTLENYLESVPAVVLSADCKWTPQEAEVASYEMDVPCIFRLVRFRYL